jgi:hypothetical protein
VGTR